VEGEMTDDEKLLATKICNDSRERVAQKDLSQRNDRELMRMALNAMESFESGTNGLYKGEFAEERKALRDRLAQYDDLDHAIAKGTKAWEGVDPTKFVEELRGESEEVPCKTHPDAPHGFDRNASHSEDRYVCECENWEPEPWVKTYCDGKPNDTSPKKEWIGLTEQDVHDAFQFTELVKQLNFDRDRPEWCENFAAHLEAKLKEKNT
jgi:hypothetical protein